MYTESKLKGFKDEKNVEKECFVKHKVVKLVDSCPIFSPTQTGLQAELTD